MGSDPKKRQKKLERKAAKRKDKKHGLVRQQNAGLAERLTEAARFPVLHCWITDSVDTDGLGYVVLSRELPNGSVAVACFLVDRYCLGIKNGFGDILGRYTYDTRFVRKMRADHAARNVPPAEARKLLDEAAAYARGLGFSPHPDAARALPLFGSVDPAGSDARFEFGKDGQPFFMAGPDDTPARCRHILAVLDAHCGPGRYHYLMPIGGGPFGDDPGAGDDVLLGPGGEGVAGLLDDLDDFDEDRA